MRSWSRANKKLASIRIGTSVCHRKNTFMSMWIPNLLVGKLFAVNRHTSSTVSSSSVTSLHHKAFNDSMEFVAFVVLSLAFVFSCAKTSKVFACLWYIFEKFEHNSWLFIHFFSFITNSNVKKDLRVLWIENRKFRMILFNICPFFLIINATLEKFLHCCLLRFWTLRFIFFH